MKFLNESVDKTKIDAIVEHVEKARELMHQADVELETANDLIFRSNVDRTSAVSYIDMMRENLVSMYDESPDTYNSEAANCQRVINELQELA